VTAANTITDTGVAFDMIAELNAARDRLDRGLDLLDRARDLRELLYMGVLELDDAHAMVAEFKRDVDAHRRQR